MVEGHRAQFGSISIDLGNLGVGQNELWRHTCFGYDPSSTSDRVTSGKAFSLSACLLIYKMETIHLPHGVAIRTASRETEL